MSYLVCANRRFAVFLLRRWFYSAETPDARIAVVGHQGAGVSSVVNSWYSALGSRIHEISLCSDGAQACTKQLAVRQLTPRICISELWGWNGVNYKRDELQLCLSGLLVNGTASSLGERERVDRLLYSLRPEERAWQHRSDVVVVVVDFTKQSTFDVAVPFLQVIRGAGLWRPLTRLISLLQVLAQWSPLHTSIARYRRFAHSVRNWQLAPAWKSRKRCRRSLHL